MSVVATIAVLGLLAAFIALAALPDITSAQGGRPAAAAACRAVVATPAPTPPPGGPVALRRLPAPPTPPPVQQRLSAARQAPTSMEGPSFVIQERQNTTRYTISVLDEDGNTADFSQRPGSEVVKVYFDVVNTAQGDVDEATSCLPMNTDAVGPGQAEKPA